jgi:hypothetical protein
MIANGRNSRFNTIKTHNLVERFDHGVLVSGVDVAGTVALAQPEDRLDDRELSRGGIKAYR